MQNIPIREAAPHIFQRPLLYINPSDSILKAATFLATGPQIYVDGLVVLDQRRKIVGRIGGYALANHILEARKNWLESSSSKIMETLEHTLREDDPTRKALQVFSETRFAFAPVASRKGDEALASLSIRDLLFLASRIIRTRIKELTSPILAIDPDASVWDGLKFMVGEGVRNLVLLKNKAGDGFGKSSGGSEPYFINDRKVLGYILAHTNKEAWTSHRSFKDSLVNTKLDALGASRGVMVDPENSAGSVSLQFDIETPCLFAGPDRVLTPWDVVMKGSGFL
jgi:CBS domain-containing protein